MGNRAEIIGEWQRSGGGGALWQRLNPPDPGDHEHLLRAVTYAMKRRHVEHGEVIATGVLAPAWAIAQRPRVRLLARDPTAAREPGIAADDPVGGVEVHGQLGIEAVAARVLGERGVEAREELRVDVGRAAGGVGDDRRQSSWRRPLALNLAKMPRFGRNRIGLRWTRKTCGVDIVVHAWHNPPQLRATARR